MDMGYKEIAGFSKAEFKVDCYYCTECLSEEVNPLYLESLTIDAIHENCFCQIAGENLPREENSTLKKALSNRNSKST